MRSLSWFENCSGILFGRSGVHIPREGYTELDLFEEIAEEIGVPVAYDIDCGHKPPQLTLINGAYAEVAVEAGAGDAGADISTLWMVVKKEPHRSGSSSFISPNNLPLPASTPSARTSHATR
ncbi:S66 peptidase family protein [Cohnella rhizosphaerae]|uniref:LD-carboxypeptidase C-terminal domain-containing protein n=1 Tax=Cohnella rhizosphaerae TaxID=1457232 RepID=A0A9X4KXP3_9BACL|nr:hypothetical protein [Cohnella rhizosphaerae]MDG0810189.1 hypothetical protein [Cohnella rhizosphaerae]